MNTPHTLSLIRVVAISLAALATTACCSQRECTRARASTPTTIDPETASAAMMEAMNPGPEHAWLAEDVGSWKGVSKSWPAPGAEAFTMPVEITVESKLGGRFVEWQYHAESAEMPVFDGLSLTGYDIAAREFQTTWIDSYGTTMMTGSGKRSADGNSIELVCGYFCPARQTRVTMWETFTRDTKDRQTHRLWANDMATGVKYLMMEAVYERQGTRASGAEK